MEFLLGIGLGLFIGVKVGRAWGYQIRVQERAKVDAAAGAILKALEETNTPVPGIEALCPVCGQWKPKIQGQAICSDCRSSVSE